MDEETGNEQLDRIEAKVNDLFHIVTGLLGGLAAAQQSGSGMAGMMARQLPDVTQLVNGN